MAWDPIQKAELWTSGQSESVRKLGASRDTSLNSCVVLVLGEFPTSAADSWAAAESRVDVSDRARGQAEGRSCRPQGTIAHNSGISSAHMQRDFRLVRAAHGTVDDGVTLQPALL